ncbi:hypothetical protein PHYPSEUDO_003035 [Phytophthora pseudosyringae]|uniref:Uncharacterized protein n=1 Tax=Phytophthora pseudosyringae TaxID=221518 RepID=A0A8T1VVS0_9STRA|nr:hypothetical protein PHYPSEUDO_003035 [Phytophthora pseudosyringae]
MPRRKRTREKIEEALRDNLRVNATPVAPEEPSAKKRRQTRLHTNKRNLNKALQAIRIGDGDEDSRPAAAPLSTVPAPGIISRMEQPCAVAPVTLLRHPTWWPSSVGDATRSNNVAGGQQYRCRRRTGIVTERAARAQRPAHERVIERERNRLRQATSPANRTEQQLHTHRELDRLRLLEVRTNHTEADAGEARERNRLGQLRTRANRTDDEEYADRENDRIRQQQLRGDHTEAEEEADRERNRLHLQQARANSTEEEQDEE